MGNCIGDFFKQCNMYCGKSALLKGKKTGVILQEICAICTWDCKFTPTRCKFTPIPSIHLACDLFLECKKCQSGPGQAPGHFAQYPVRREWFRPKTSRFLLVANWNVLISIVDIFKRKFSTILISCFHHKLNENVLRVRSNFAL